MRRRLWSARDNNSAIFANTLAQLSPEPLTVVVVGEGDDCGGMGGVVVVVGKEMG